MTKDQIRERMRHERRTLSSEFLTVSGTEISNRILDCGSIRQATTVMLFLPSFNEPQIDEVFARLWDISIKTAVPVSDTDNFTITPYLIDDLNYVRKGAYGIREPIKTHAIAIADIDTAVIPGVAFSKNGDRLGFGKGYYDRFLAEFRGVKHGVCYDFQVLDTLPAAPHDVKMDTIITEKRIYNDF